MNAVFLLAQRKPATPGQLSEKIGQPMREVAHRAFLTKFVAERMLPLFVGFSGSEDDEAPVGVEADMFDAILASLLPQGAAPAPHPAHAARDGRDAPWRLAFYDLLESLGPQQAVLLDTLAAKSEEAAENVRAYLRARERLRSIDDLVARQQPFLAYLAARDAVEAGFSCCSSRYLVLTSLLCADPADMDRAVEEHGSVCGKGFVNRLRLEMQNFAEHEGASAGVDLGGRASGHAPAIYQTLDQPHPAYSPAATTLWEILRRARRGAPPRTKTYATPLVILGTAGAGEAEAASAAASLRASGAWVVLVQNGPPAAAARPAPAATVGSFPEAAEAIETLLASAPCGPVVVSEEFAPIPAALLQILPLAFDADEAVPLTVDRRATWGRAEDALAGFESTIGGICLRSGEAALRLLRATDQPRLAGEELAAAGRLPIAVHASIIEAPSVEEFVHPTVVLSVGGAPSALPPGVPPECVLEVEAGLSGAETSARLADRQRELGLPDDAACVYLAPEFSYEEGYVAALVRRFELEGARLPVAARGLRIRRRDSRIVFADNSALHGGLHRAAALCCACLTLREAIGALAEWGPRGAASCVVRFSPAAAAWDAGAALLHGPWTQLAAAIDASGQVPQQVFEAQSASLSARLTDLAARGACAPPPAHHRYLRTLEAALARMSDDSDEDLSATLLDLLDGGALSLLLNDGQGCAVAIFLEHAIPRLSRPQGLSRDQIAALLDLALECGIQARIVGHVASFWLPRASDPRSFGPLMTFIVASGGADLVKASLVCALERMLALPEGRHKRRFVGGLSHFAGEFLEGEGLEFMLRRIVVELGARLPGHLDALRLIGRAELRNPRLAGALPLGYASEAMRAAVPRPERLAQALAAGDRERALALFRGMAEQEGATLGLVLALRTLSAEAAALGVTARDWPYPAYGGPRETLALATILGDVATIEALADAKAGGGVKAAARKAAGDCSALDALFADWARREGLAAPSFAGGDIYALFGRLAGFAAPPERRDDPAGAKGASLVSVIVTLFEPDLDLLRLALESIRHQTWRDIETIVVDDGSAPETARAAEALCAGFARTQFIAAPRNCGPYVSRNRALEAASGEFVAIQDADDVSHPQRIAHQVAALRRDARVEATASRHMRFDRMGRVQFQQDMSLAADGTMTTMFRRPVFDRLGRFTATRSRGDVEYRERIRQAFGPAAFVETACPLVFCYGAPSTLSNSVVREKAAALRAFRHSFGLRRWIQGSDGPRPLGELSVPATLRP